MKYSEAEKQIKALSSKYDIDMRGGDFDVAYNGRTHVIYVSGDYEYGIYVGYPEMFSVIPSSNKLYMILSELAMTPLDERIGEKKYRVKAFEDYLNLNVDTLRAFLFGKSETEFCQTCFTLKEIEQLKQREDIPLDWDKVELEEEHD
ncbi:MULTISPECIES: hypothetical protein [Lactiplantibacillus]|uniref:hypothetical protein n=1 Tax=Lactiplantibacillus TaxID=2767842 RepID=UPI001C1F58E8|nr:MULTISPECIES: hypothetical protein [Lactiplantibacillus]MBU7447079.1 hypothetical protein [Lactiplantibacillus sp. 7.2.4]MBU7480292.1 hypothetical protein [Lactiplantibacillus pentosus]